MVLSHQRLLDKVTIISCWERGAIYIFTHMEFTKNRVGCHPAKALTEMSKQKCPGSGGSHHD